MEVVICKPFETSVEKIYYSQKMSDSVCMDWILSSNFQSYIRNRHSLNSCVYNCISAVFNENKNEIKFN